ncbi:nuclear cap binding complex subunit [Entomophthora muscae]|uniref:Nuclear cap binding complex subunit n=2 Tax=Entomophthora muscae TaxID=34485 RepID=A0ACC2UQN7_9FUNG|nr:nuclear cap binding complex subunit [Entomophthora muscae]KAJ9089242.1 nuclear cap binding complex subunit [Entomophthora muscae]
MASLLQRLDAPSSYKDTKSTLSEKEIKNELERTTTLYVGNLSFYTSEEQIHELFSTCGEIKRIIMGLDREKKTPCGFCFVEYYRHSDALDCLKFINSTKLDDRIIRTDIDPGFKEGRQYGRGRNGGQVRDEFRVEFDAGRGGWGHMQANIERQREAKSKAIYDNVGNAPVGASSKYVAFKSSKGEVKKRGRDDDEEEEGMVSPKKIKEEISNPRFHDEADRANEGL